MAKDSNLSAQEIYEKEFHVDLKGYAPSEVDEFLDLVIEDYQNYEEKLEELGQAVLRYENRIKELQQAVDTLQLQNQDLIEQASSQYINPSMDFPDLLQRIARLEEAVFKGETAEETK